MWVLDATPLIYLSKATALGYLESLDGDRLVPRRVYDEVVTAGLERSYPDARRIDRHVESGVLEVVRASETDLFDRLAATSTVSDADVAVLALAAERNGTAVMDDGYGRDVARTEGIPTRGTAYLLLSLVRDGHVSADEARRTIDEMLEAGWYCSPDLYATILEKLESLS